MGWKNIHKKFKIIHITQIRDGRICIGSPYMCEIISISFEGKIIKSYKDRENEDLNRYQSEIEEAEKTGELKKLIETPDHFVNLKIIYTGEKGRIIKKYCEEYDYPNICTDGELIYTNTFFKDKKEAKKYYKNDARLEVKYLVKSFRENFITLNKRMFKSAKGLTIAIWEYILIHLF